MVDSKDKASNTAQTLSIISSLLGLVLMIIFVILGSLIKGDLPYILYPLSTFFGDNWSGGPIASIESESSSCPVGSSYLLSDITFPAIEQGCFCLPNQIIPGDSCTEVQTQNSCQSYGATQSNPIYVWDGSTLCSNRQANTNYFNLNIQTSTEGCLSANMKACGVADSIGSILCVQTTEDCPINYFIIENSDQVSTQSFPVSTINLKQNKVLTYSNQNTNGNIVNQFMIVDHVPCANEMENRLMFMGNDYICKTSIDGSTTDNAWNLVDTLTLSELVEDNNVQLIDQLPFYDLIKNENVYLYQRSYVGLQQSCIKSALSLYEATNIPGMFLNLKSNVETSPIDYISMITITLFAFLFICLILRIVFVFADFSETSKLNLNTVLAFCAILLLIVACIATISISNVRNTYIWFNYNCSDPISYGNLLELDSELYKIYAIGVVYTIFSLILFFLIISEYLLANCGGSQEEEELDDYLEDGKLLSDSAEEENDNEDTKNLKNNKKKQNENASINKDLEDDDEDVLIDKNKKYQ